MRKFSLVLAAAVMAVGLAVAGALSKAEAGDYRTLGAGAVKPPFYVPLPDRVSGTGGRMFRA